MDVTAYTTIDSTHVGKEYVLKESCGHANAANLLIKNETNLNNEYQILPKKKNYLCYSAILLHTKIMTLKPHCYRYKGRIM